MKGAIDVMHDLREICNASRSCLDCPLNDVICLEAPFQWDDDDIQYIVKNAKCIKEDLTHEA